MRKTFDSLSQQYNRVQFSTKNSECSSFSVFHANGAVVNNSTTSSLPFPSPLQQLFPSLSPLDNTSPLQWNSSASYSVDFGNQNTYESGSAAQQNRENMDELRGEFDSVSGIQDNGNSMRGCKVIAKGKDKSNCSSMICYKNEMIGLLFIWLVPLSSCWNFLLITTFATRTKITKKSHTTLTRTCTDFP